MVAQLAAWLALRRRLAPSHCRAARLDRLHSGQSNEGVGSCLGAGYRVALNPTGGYRRISYNRIAKPSSTGRKAAISPRGLAPIEMQRKREVTQPMPSRDYINKCGYPFFKWMDILCSDGPEQEYIRNWCRKKNLIHSTLLVLVSLREYNPSNTLPPELSQQRLFFISTWLSFFEYRHKYPDKWELASTDKRQAHITRIARLANELALAMEEDIHPKCHPNARILANLLADKFQKTFNRTPNDVIAACVCLRYPDIDPPPDEDTIRK